MLGRPMQHAGCRLWAGRCLAVTGLNLLLALAFVPGVAVADSRITESRIELPLGIAPLSAVALSEQYAMGVDSEPGLPSSSERKSAVILFDEAGGGGPVKFGLAATGGGPHRTASFAAQDASR